jgi:hypothetical protein
MADDYQHPHKDPNLSGPNRAMEYDDDGEPVVRVSIEKVKPNSGLGTSNYNTDGNFNTGTDAFGRLRISQPTTLFEANHVEGSNNRFYTTVTGVGSVTYNTDISAASLNADGTGGAASVRYRSKRRMSYQPGKSLLIMSTFTMSAVTDGVVQCVGYYDNEDGFYLKNTGGALSLVRRSSTSGSVTEEVVEQADWNGDKLDGTGASGVTLDITKSQILFMDIEWLGVGSVRCGFIINGQFIITHIFHHANTKMDTYIKTASQQLTMEIESTNGQYAELHHICSTVISEGGYEPRAEGKVAGTPSLSGVTVNQDWINLVTIRMDSAYPKSVIVPAGIDILNVSNTDFEWGLFVDATPTSALTWSNPVTEKVEVATDTVTFTDLGSRIYGGYMGGKTAPASIGDGQLSWDNQLGKRSETEYQTLTLAIRSGSNSKTAAGLIKWYQIGGVI